MGNKVKLTIKQTDIVKKKNVDQQGNHFSQCVGQALNAPQSWGNPDLKFSEYNNSWNWAVTQFTVKMTFWTAYLRSAAQCWWGVCFPPAAVILTDYFITLKSLLFPQSNRRASGCTSLHFVCRFTQSARKVQSDL